MPWSEQCEPQFLNSIYPMDMDYLGVPVWKNVHPDTKSVCYVLLDGKYGMYKYASATTGIVPRELSGLYRDKNVLIAKVKQYLMTRKDGGQYTEEEVNKIATDEEVKEAIAYLKTPIDERPKKLEKRRAEAKERKVSRKQNLFEALV